MGSFGLQNSCHPVWQRVVELVDEVVRDGMEGHLAGIPKLLQVLCLGPPSFLFQVLPQICSIIFISWRLCWPSLKDLDLLPPEKLHSGTWGMARSSILLKNLTPLVVGNVLRGKNLLILGTINVTIHLTDLPGTSVMDVTPKHNLSTFWVNRGSRRAPEGRRQYWRRLEGSSTDDSLEKYIFRHFSAVQPSVRLWALV